MPREVPAQSQNDLGQIAADVTLLHSHLANAILTLQTGLVQPEILLDYLLYGRRGLGHSQLLQSVASHG